jgi:hypothetical protein
MSERNNLNTMARDDFWRAAQVAREQGKDLAEVLDRAGVLLTPARLRRIQADVLFDVAEMLDSFPASYTWPPGGAVEWIRKLAQATNKVGWRGP